VPGFPGTCKLSRDKGFQRLKPVLETLDFAIGAIRKWQSFTHGPEDVRRTVSQVSKLKFERPDKALALCLDLPVTRSSGRPPARAGDNPFAVDAIRKHHCTTHGPEARVTMKSPVEFAF